MPHLSSPAIILRTIAHGDYDKILTFFTLKLGKISLIAKGAQKSIKRFGGILELFSALDLVWAQGRGRGLPVLKEASIIHPFDRIRTNITSTAYASFWCELVCLWTEPGQEQPSVFRLLEHVLQELDAGEISEAILHIAFQLNFMGFNGFGPGFRECLKCHLPLDRFGRSAVVFNVRQGGVFCEKCGPLKPGTLSLSKGTAKLLGWVSKAPLENLNRIRFSGQALHESMVVLEAFVPYHLGKETKSMKFLKQLVALPL